jgi:hypothetical protein
MGLLNVLGSLQNIESAEAGGDRYATAPSLAVNGLGTIAAGLFGSCFPTTIYIGHPAWKSMGAKAGYSIVNGLFFTILFLFGCGTFLKELIPIEAGAAIVMYIGIVITAQAFEATPRRHAPAVAIALFPGLAATLALILPLFLIDANAPLTIAELIRNIGPTTQVPTLPGILALFGANAGWMLSALILTAIAVAFIEKQYRAATIWCAAATILTLVGWLHSYRVEGNVIREFFIWQPTPVVAAVTEPSPAVPIESQPTATLTEASEPAVADLTSTQPTVAATEAQPTPAAPVETEPAPAATASAPPVFAYRAYPLTIGYAVATVIFGLAAMRSRKEDEQAGTSAASRIRSPGQEPQNTPADEEDLPPGVSV